MRKRLGCLPYFSQGGQTVVAYEGVPTQKKPKKTTSFEDRVDSMLEEKGGTKAAIYISKPGHVESWEEEEETV